MASLAGSNVVRAREQSQLFFIDKPLPANLNSGRTALPEKPPQRFLMYTYLPGRFTYAYVILQVYHCCFKQLQSYPIALPSSNESPTSATSFAFSSWPSICPHSAPILPF
jgi:hypothetical protein